MLNSIDITSPEFVSFLWNNYSLNLNIPNITFHDYCELMNLILDISSSSQNLNLIFNEWDLNCRNQFNFEVNILNGLCDYHLFTSQSLTGEKLRMICNYIEKGMVMDENLKLYPWYQLVEPIAKICVFKANSFKVTNILIYLFYSRN